MEAQPKEAIQETTEKLNEVTLDPNQQPKPGDKKEPTEQDAQPQDKKKVNKKELKKQQNKDKEPKQPKAQKKADKNELFAACDLRVGKVLECKILEGFNDVYALKIDLNEGEPRIIGTGLRQYVPAEVIQDSSVIVFSNLKPKKFGNALASQGMIMCASISNEEKKETIELLRPHEDAKPGDKVYLEGTELNKEVCPVLSSGRFSKAIELFASDGECFAMYNGIKMRTETGFIKAPTLKNAHIS